MRTSTPALAAALLANEPLFSWDLYEITLVTGQVIRWSTSDQDITISGNTYYSAYNQIQKAPAVTRSNWTQSCTLEVDTMEISIAATPDMHVLGIPVLAAINRGYFAGASITILRFYTRSVDPIDYTLGTITLPCSPGRIGNITTLRASARISVNSWLILLNTPVPRTTVQTGCIYSLGDVGCGVDLSTFTVSGSITSATKFQLITSLTPTSAPNPPTVAPTLSHVSSDTNLPATIYYVVYTYVTGLGETTASPEAHISVAVNELLKITSPASVAGALGWNAYVSTVPGAEMLQNSVAIAFGDDWTEGGDGIVQNVIPPQLDTLGYYAGGTITFTSGTLNGLSAHIDANTGGTLKMTVPLLVAPAGGDTFTIIPGDDKSITTCDQKFNNRLRYGGAPYIPQPEVLA